MTTETPESIAPAPVRITMGRIVLAILVVLIPIAVLVVWRTLPVGQEASAVILIEGPLKPLDYSLTPPPPTNDMINRQVAITAQSIRDEGLLREVLTDPDIRNCRWYTENPDKQQLLDELKRGLTVSTTPDTGLVTISFRAESPEDAGRIVNTVALCYLVRTERYYRNAYAARLDAMTKQETDIRRDLKKLWDQSEAFLTSQLDSPGLVFGVNLPAEVCRYLAVEQARLDIEVERLRIARNEFAGNTSTQTAATSQSAKLEAGPDDNRSEQAKAIEADYLSTVQLQLALQEKMNAEKSKLRDAERKIRQYESLLREKALLEKQCERIADEINSLQTVLRGSACQVHVTRLALTSQPYSLP